ncbi:MAG: hypothetical protein FI729_01925 [SAR202 cluster bacterium]|nr:hypothetical protein [SAR202 cluster bacterium]|tara:strand:- start:24 stop:401 length:378 start_codon:yes stop_codon:yes gene_type:complete
MSTIRIQGVQLPSSSQIMTGAYASGILPSGESNFFDHTSPDPTSVPPGAPTGQYGRNIALAQTFPSAYMSGVNLEEYFNNSGVYVTYHTSLSTISEEAKLERGITSSILAPDGLSTKFSNSMGQA